jgi:hypothetical protein
MAPVLLNSKIGSINEMISLGDQHICGLCRHCFTVNPVVTQGSLMLEFGPNVKTMITLILDDENP